MNIKLYPKESYEKYASVSAVRVTMYKLVVHNKDSSMGQYYAEDDWSIVVYAPTLEDLQKDAAVPLGESDIYISGWHVYKVDCIVVLLYANDELKETKLFELDDPYCLPEFDGGSKKFDQSACRNFFEGIVQTDAYKQARDKRLAEKKKEEEDERLEEQQEEERRERKRLTELKKKYEETD